MLKAKLLFRTIVFILIGFQGLKAQEGVLSGKIIDKSSGEPIIGAVIQTEDSQHGVTTDLDGAYILKLPAGHYMIEVRMISYGVQKFDIHLDPGKSVVLNAVLEEESVSMEEVVVTYNIQRSSTLSQMIERRNAAVISDGISSEAIKKTPDRNASDALKRITGASIQDGRFAIIRGMNDRYNAGLLDGFNLPSTESDRKAFSFDIIPSILIDKMQVIKAGIPEMPGDFGGGIIKINTKGIPEKLTQQINIGGQWHSLTTFKNFEGLKKYGIENSGLVSSKRNLPDVAESDMRISGSYSNVSDRARLAENSNKFNLNWDRSNSMASPNTRLSYSLGLPLMVRQDRKLGMILALNYANTRKFTVADVASYDGSGQVADLHDQVFNQNITSGGIFNLNYTDRNVQLSLNNLVNINTDFNAINRNGLGNINDYIEVNNKVNLVTSSVFTNHVLNYKQLLGNGYTIESSVGLGAIMRSIPEYKIASYTRNPESESYGLALGDFFNSSTGIFSSRLKENVGSASLNISKSFEKAIIPTELKLGYSAQLRVREFASRNFVYSGNSIGELSYNPSIDLGKDKIGANSLYLVEKTSDDLAYYNGYQTIHAAYISADQKIFKSLRAVYGIRFENADIKVSNDKVGMEISHIKQSNVLPSVNLNYSMGSAVNLRLAYFGSVNRPEFREMAPFAFYAFDKNAEIRGNRDLKIATLHNFECRAEFFPSGGQVLSAGVFYKKINNPIEFNIDVTQPFTTFTFENEKSANLLGVELEMRKNLDFINVQKVWREISFIGNLALIKSTLQFEEGSHAVSNRPLQGQSPYVLNLGLQYDSEQTGWSGSLVFNRIGRRIAFVGVDPKFGDTRRDIYEAPRSVIDLQIGKSIGRFNMKATLGDILRSDLVFYQDVNNSGKYEASNDRRMFRFLNGRTLSLSATYLF